jgi:tetratricopeptide (TPR) repeat protein
MIKVAMALFGGSALFDYFISMRNDSRPIAVHNGEIAYNDGYNLRQIFRWGRQRDFKLGINAVQKNDMAMASEHFQNLLRRGNKDSVLYRLAINACYGAGNYDQALFLHHQYVTLHVPSADDLVTLGLVHLGLEQTEACINNFKQALEMVPDHLYALNNLGFVYNKLEQYEMALEHLDKCILKDASFVHAYSNRGLTKLKTGKEEEGLMDLNHALELDPNNAYAHRNYGIYHFDKGQYNEALKYFEKARQIDPWTDDIDGYLKQTEEKLRVQPE